MDVFSLPSSRKRDFSPVISRVKKVQSHNSATAAAVFIIQDDAVVAEWYEGRHELAKDSRTVRPDSQFNVYSVRKTYIGFAVAFAFAKGFLDNLEQPIAEFLVEPDQNLLGKTSIRHLLTHTHGLDEQAGRYFRKFPPGTKWHYTNAGIVLLCRIIERVCGQTVEEIIAEEVIKKMGFVETGWRRRPADALVHDVQNPQKQAPLLLEGRGGDGRNLYISARELAYWGYIHLRQGAIGELQLLSAEWFSQIAAVQSPAALGRRYPRQGFCWWIQQPGIRSTELGGSVPENSYQILGMSGCLCLVLPAYNAVAVRMYNSLCNRLTFIRDAKNFGDLSVACLAKG